MPKIKLVDPDLELARVVAIETFKIIKTKNITNKFLRYFVREMVLESLTRHSSRKPTKEAYELTKKLFSETKLEMQNEISSGFELAFKFFSGRDSEYYCQINPVPEVANKEMI